MDEKPRVSRPFLIYVFAVLSAALIVGAYAWELHPLELSPQFALLAIAVVLSENYAFSIEPYSISLAFPLAMAGVILGGPACGCVIGALSSTNYREIKARKPLPLIGFNLGQIVLSAALAGLTYARLGGRFLQAADGSMTGWGPADFPQTLIPMVAAAVVCVAANMFLTAGAMAILTRSPIRAAAATMVAFVPTQLALAFVGYLIAETLAISVLALPLFVAPLVVARQLYMRYADLKTAFVDTVRSLVGALEAKDPYTRGHSERVSEYSAVVGRTLGLGPKEIERLEYAALLHDLGKLAVPSAILVKPGRLTDDEMNSVKLHPGRGAEMIRRIPPLRDLADAVAQHHEWFDGSGYPGGLSGSDMSTASRILCVADSFDAMTSSRAYRPALSRSEAIAELIRGAGSQFDPEIVRVFIESRVGLPGQADEESPSLANPAHESQPIGLGGLD